MSLWFERAVSSSFSSLFFLNFSTSAESRSLISRLLKMEITFCNSSGSVEISGRDLSISLKVKKPCSLERLISLRTLSVISFLRAWGSTDLLTDLAASLADVFTATFAGTFFLSD